MKTIFKKLKKGFTIVELVIVIAVIAILAAVLIPTLANLVDSANESNDMVLVSNLNKIVAAYDTVGEIETVNDALDGALENGYSVSNLTPTSEGNVIVYDSVSNRFALLTANALTADATDDDVIYKDTSTTKTDWTDYTTWVFVDASATSNYVTITTSGESYTLSGTNSYILTGTDWNGRSVVANYGLVLFDSTKTITLNSVTVKESTQTGVKADTNSSAKTAISKKAIDNTNSAISIVVNVKAIYLICTAENYAIDNYSTISISTTIKNCQFNEHGATAVYDAKEIGSGAINNYNSNIGSVTVNLATGADISKIFVNKTTAAIEVETLINATITISTIESEDGTTTTTLELGTKKYPYLIDDLSAITTKISESSESTTTVYFELSADISLTEELNLTIEKDIVIDGSGNDLQLGDYELFLTTTDNNITIKDLNIGTTMSDTGIVGNMPFIIKGTSINIIGCEFTGTNPGCYVLRLYADSQVANIVVDDCTFTNAIISLNSVDNGTLSVNDTLFTATGTASTNAYGIATVSCNEVEINLTRCSFTELIRYGIYNQGHITLNLNAVNFDTKCKYTDTEAQLAVVLPNYTISCEFCSSNYTVSSNVNSSFKYTEVDGTTTDISANYAAESN